jgi:hypothetical protein
MDQKEQFQSSAAPKPFAQTYFHGTKASLMLGDLIEAGIQSNFGDRAPAKYIYLTSTLDAAIWGAELAAGESKGRIYLVEPTGPIEDDPNLTNKKFPGNPSMSYRSKSPFKVVGELASWQGHAEEQVKAMKEGLQKLREQGLDVIED